MQALKSPLRYSSRHFISAANFVIVDLDLKLADMAEKIRAEIGLGLSDAIVVACGLAKGAKYFVTHDKDLKKAGHYFEILTSKEFIKKHSK